MLKSGDLNELLKANGRKDGRYEFRKGIKFSLNKDGLERRISHLRTAIKDLGKLRELNALLHDNGVQSCSRTMKEFSSFLQRVQRHADSLYGAIAHGLSSGCHYEHGTRFYLEGQSAILQKKPLPINFELALETPEAPIVGRNLHHEIRIEVLEDDMDRYDSAMLLTMDNVLTEDVDHIPNRDRSGPWSGSTFPNLGRLLIR